MSTLVGSGLVHRKFRGKSTMKTILVLLMLSVGLLWSLLPAQDMTSFVSSSERLEKVFEGKNVSSPNNMQALLIKLCAFVDTCGT